MNFRDFTNYLHTGKDNATPDLGRVSWTVCIVTVIAHSIVLAWRGVALDLMQLAGALGAVAGVHGAALWAKRATEPEPEKKEP